MIVAVKKLQNGQMYIDKSFMDRFSEDELPLYGYTPCWVDEDQADCCPSDFIELNGVITFSFDTYVKRKGVEQNNARIQEIKPRLSELSQDFIQATAGAVFPDIADRINEFRTLHNELRSLLGKAPRVYQ